MADLAQAFPQNQEWFSVEEAANYLRVSKRTIYSWAGQRLLRAHRTPKAGLLRFKRNDLDAVLTTDSAGDQNLVHGTDDPVLTELWGNKADAAYDKL